MNQAFLSLGTNIEPRLDYLDEAIELLEDHRDITVNRKSSIYETVPVGYANQADFLNMVVGIETSLQPFALLDYCQQIENRLGRKRNIRFGPRTIDLDILTYNLENSTVEKLLIPHPRMNERAFVLIPLHEIAPDFKIPLWNKRARELLQLLQESDIKGVRKWTQNG
ncbi:2-amino-4-hydroxy-6-hydroxymethyldihydropteridine diphosphokinase [Oceanobacillus halophilus]|uniref:2-amino-4-hydroxy-6-hydroxymethyldihydropteridine diphosphokinase n=1 Tax=Oceanobacillus halophilus TaxID=930130 RepID=A0A495A1E0_9BACI|nr:2-amino-4-hydroxy-6-hydroxymethyldihydropteridine diphosphokinase [Oceanobacillus halophilus]RKQ33048.1 2-amino-4-hydroxy-6-hydroxymethyldihydropteridine diphosphokinase [Oceanobacillus halophilus]